MYDWGPPLLGKFKLISSTDWVSSQFRAYVRFFGLIVLCGTGISISSKHYWVHCLHPALQATNAARYCALLCLRSAPIFLTWIRKPWSGTCPMCSMLFDGHKMRSAAPEETRQSLEICLRKIGLDIEQLAIVDGYAIDVLVLPQKELEKQWQSNSIRHRERCTFAVENHWDKLWWNSLLDDHNYEFTECFVDLYTCSLFIIIIIVAITDIYTHMICNVYIYNI